MVTKGIIKTIDYNGNTCTVRVPFFETANNDEIISTATVSNTPGSYNGYKVGDVVWVAFEDGSMDHPVVIGKLYLGVENEKADPRGALNVVDSRVSNSAEIPFDTKLNANLAENVASTNVPFSSLDQVANSLSTAEVNIAQNDRDYGNTFKQIISNANGLKSEFEQAAGKFVAKVSGYKLDDDGTPLENEKETTFGWKLDAESWTVFSEDKNILEANSDGLKVTGRIEATDGDIGKFIIGKIHNRTNDQGEEVTDEDGKPIPESGIYTENYIDCFKQTPGKDFNLDNQTLSGESGVYIGTDGIKLGENFSVDPDGSLVAKDGHIGKFNIGAEHNFNIIDSTGTLVGTIVASGIYSDDYATSFAGKPQDTNTNKTGVYIGTDGIKLGENFSVDIYGNVKATSLFVDGDGTSSNFWSLFNLPAQLDGIEKAAQSYTNTALNNAFTVNDSTVDEYTTVGNQWLSTTNVYAQNLHVANADITNQILVGDEDSPILYANVDDTENVKIGGFTVTSNSITSGNKTGNDLATGTAESGVYIGPDGISIGSGFKVTASGESYISNVQLTDEQKADLKLKYEDLTTEQKEELKGDAGRSVSSTVKYYKLTNSTPTDITSDYTAENPPDGWNLTPDSFAGKDSSYNYYETVRAKYNDNTYSWSTPVKNSMLTVDFINSLGITAEKIDIGNTFSADAAKGNVTVAGFTASSTALYSSNHENGNFKNSIYLGTDKIESVGTNYTFKVTDGQVTANSLNIGTLLNITGNDDKATIKTTITTKNADNKESLVILSTGELIDYTDEKWNDYWKNDDDTLVGIGGSSTNSALYNNYKWNLVVGRHVGICTSTDTGLSSFYANRGQVGGFNINSAGLRRPEISGVQIEPYIITNAKLNYTVADGYEKVNDAKDHSSSTVGMCFLENANAYAFWAGKESNLGNKEFRVGHDGTVYTKGGVVYSSDANLKDNILDLKELGDYDTFFDNLKSRTFKFTGDATTTHIGFIAQEVKAALTTAGLTKTNFAGFKTWTHTNILEDDEGNKTEEDHIGYGLNYSEFIALNTAQIQKLKNQVAAQEERIAALEKIIKDLPTE